jgi:hypothetical protein
MHYIEIAVLTLLGYPACAFTGVVSIGIFNIPLSGSLRHEIVSRP